MISLVILLLTQHQESEVREARKLKSSHENIELLKEKFLEEKGRRERAELDLLKLSDIQLSAKKLEDELSAWKLMMKDIPGVSCADDLPLKFAGLQKYVSNLFVQFWLNFCSNLLSSGKKSYYKTFNK